jgi:glycosyltransferase involved in cell wall biosynthesis
MLQGLYEEHDFTVFSAELDNPAPERIRWVRIPAPSRPLPLRYVIYHLLAPLYFHLYCRRYQSQFDVVQTVEATLGCSDILYPHFCNRSYLKHYWRQSKPVGIRRWSRWLDHKLPEILEGWGFQKARHIVVPSRGLARELNAEYPYTEGRTHVLPNPVDLDYMRRPRDFDREGFRRKHGLKTQQLVLVFIALGHFERKGLPALLDALSRMREGSLRLVVVGGPAGLISQYTSRAHRLGLGAQVSFVGMQSDVRPFLWSADAFVFPSFYEVFPLVALEAAAAAVPLIVTPINGVEEFISDGVNGILAERTIQGLISALGRFVAMSPDERRMMGQQAQCDVEGYGTENFIAAWRRFYAEHANHVG